MVVLFSQSNNRIKLSMHRGLCSCSSVKGANWNRWIRSPWEVERLRSEVVAPATLGLPGRAGIPGARKRMLSDIWHAMVQIFKEFFLIMYVCVCAHAHSYASVTERNEADVDLCRWLLMTIYLTFLAKTIQSFCSDTNWSACLLFVSKPVTMEIVTSCWHNCWRLYFKAWA